MSNEDSPESFRAIVETTTDAAFITDSKGVITYISPSGGAMFRCEPSDMEGHHFVEFLAAESVEKATSAFTAVLERSKPTVRLELAMKRCDQSHFFGELTGGFFQTDTLAGTAGVIRDVSERKRAEEETHQLKDFYGSILDSVQDGIWVTDSDERLVYFNPGMEIISGVPAADVLGLDVTRDFPPETSGEFLEFYRRAKQERVPQAYEVAVVTPAGRPNVQSGWLVPRFEGGTYRGMICTIRDVTEQKKAEEQLRLTQLSVDSAGEMVAWLDKEGRLLYVNESFCRGHGYSREELLGMAIYDLDPSLSVGEWPERWLEDRRRGPVPFEAVHRAKDGRLFPVEVVVHNVERAAAGFNVAFHRDIAERKAAEESLRESEAQLRQSQKMEAIGQLAGGIAHDFNNLLAAILGYSDLMLSGPEIRDPTTRSQLAEIKRAAERASGLTKQILAFSRRQALRPSVLSLNQVVEGLEPLLRRTLGEDIELRIEASPALAPVEADAHQLEQVIMNLALNARDAMPAGGRLTLETGNVRIDDRFCRTHPGVTPGGYVELSVSDTGLGMDTLTREHVFEPFFTTKSPGEGTGLGLSVVHGIVMQSQGHIFLDSEPGRGTRFSIYLPAADVPSGRGAAASDEAACGGSETVLLVEDEDAVRGLVVRQLSDLGYRVLPAKTAEDALLLVGEMGGSLDLLLTDVVLPGVLQGSDLARELVGQRPALPVLYMSGYPRGAIVHAGRLDEGVHLLEKPFTRDALDRSVREVLRGASGSPVAG